MKAIKQFIKNYIEQYIPLSYQSQQKNFPKFVINTSKIMSNIKIYSNNKIDEIFLSVALKPILQHPKHKIFLKMLYDNTTISAEIYEHPIITAIDIEFQNYGFFEQNNEKVTFFSNKINDQISIDIKDKKLATKQFPYINQDIHINVTKNLSNNLTKQNGYDIIFFPYEYKIDNSRSLLNNELNYVRFYGKTSVSKMFTNSSDFFKETNFSLPINSTINNIEIFTEKFNFTKEDFESLQDFVKNKNIKFKLNTGEKFSSVDIINTSNDQILIKFQNIE